MPSNPRLTQPTLRILKQMLENMSPTAGAALAKATGIGSGTLYPTLLRLEEAGWLSSEWEQGEPTQLGRPRKRFYKLTGLGHRKANRSTWRARDTDGGARMAGVVDILITAIAGVGLSLLASEIYDRAGAWAARIIRFAAARLPAEQSARMQEEWAAHLLECPGKLGKLSHALGCLQASWLLCRPWITYRAARSAVANSNVAMFRSWLWVLETEVLLAGERRREAVKPLHLDQIERSLDLYARLLYLRVLVRRECKFAPLFLVPPFPPALRRLLSDRDVDADVSQRLARYLQSDTKNL